MEQDSPVVLVVDDERDLADLFTAWLTPDYAVRTAYSGRQALDVLDERVDVVLLDRRMPELSGDDVLATIRERGLECRVAMVTAVDPDFDILEMGFDDYVTKPVTSDELLDVVETLLERRHHDAALQRYYRLVTKQVALEAQHGDAAADNPEYRALRSDIRSLRADLEDLVAGFGDDDFETQLRRLGRADGNPADDARRDDDRARDLRSGGSPADDTHSHGADTHSHDADTEGGV